MGDLMKRVMAWPWVAHLLRALDRFGSRLGTQFAAAITYFSVLAIIPILMLGFAILGLTIDVLRPDLAQAMVTAIETRLESIIPVTAGATGSSAHDIARSLVGMLKNWRGVGSVGLLSAAYAGSGWVGNIQRAINAMWLRAGISPVSRSLWGRVVAIGRNLAVLLGLIVLGGLTVAVSLSATAAQDLLLGWLGLAESGTASFFTVVVAVLVSLLSGWVLFLYLYTVLPRERVPWRAVTRGALFGSVGLAALQYFAGALNSIFVRNSAATIFGPVIVLVLSLNVFATLVMLGAAWTSTAHVVDEPLAVDGDEAEPTMLPLAENPYVTGHVLVSPKVAKRGVTAGIVTGYALGGAAGVGLGAVLGRLAGAVVHRRRRR